MEKNMEKPKESKLEPIVEVHMRVVANGVVVTGKRCDDYAEGPVDKEYEFVYTTIDKALKEVPSLVSTLKEDSRKPTKRELDEEEERINKGEEE
jgi:hypothetical protein